VNELDESAMNDQCSRKLALAVIQRAAFKNQRKIKERIENIILPVNSPQTFRNVHPLHMHVQFKIML